jgi:hypothetical protein
VDDEKGISLLTMKTDSLAFALADRPSLRRRLCLVSVSRPSVFRLSCVAVLDVSHQL